MGNQAGTVYFPTQKKGAVVSNIHWVRLMIYFPFSYFG